MQGSKTRQCRIGWITLFSRLLRKTKLFKQHRSTPRRVLMSWQVKFRPIAKMCQSCRPPSNMASPISKRCFPKSTGQSDKPSPGPGIGNPGCRDHTCWQASLVCWWAWFAFWYAHLMDFMEQSRGTDYGVSWHFWAFGWLNVLPMMFLSFTLWTTDMSSLERRLRPICVSEEMKLAQLWIFFSKLKITNTCARRLSRGGCQSIRWSQSSFCRWTWAGPALANGTATNLCVLPAQSTGRRPSDATTLCSCSRHHSGRLSPVSTVTLARS